MVDREWICFSILNVDDFYFFNYKMTRKLLKIALVVLLSVVSISIDAQEKPVLWYDKPARYWEEALPLGNGRLGAMVYGNPVTEEIQLNEETVSARSPNKN